MKKEYDSPEIEKFEFSFEDILNNKLNVSDNESGTDESSINDDGDW